MYSSGISVMRVFMLLITLLCVSLLQAQNLQLAQCEEIEDYKRYIGSADNRHFFEGHYKVEAYDSRGYLADTYEFPAFLKYNDQKLYEHKAVLWNGHPYYIAQSRYSKKAPMIHVMFKLHENRKATEDDGILIATVNFPKKAGRIKHEYHTEYKVIDGDFYYMNLVAPNTKKEFPFHVSLVKVSKDEFQSQQICSSRFPGSLMYDFGNIDFNKNRIYFNYTLHEQGIKMGVCNMTKCEFESREFSFLDNASMYIYSHFVHPETGEVYRLGGSKSKEDGEMKLYTQKFTKDFEHEDTELYTIKDLPSYSLTGRIEVEWSEGSQFKDVVRPDIIGSLIINDLFVDPSGNIIVIYEVLVSNSTESESYMFGQEVIVASYDPETLRQNWRTVIPKSQETEGVTDPLFGLPSHLFVGAVSFPYHDGIMVIFNDHYKNSQRSLDKNIIEGWSRAGSSNIVGVEVDYSGKSKKTVLSRVKGQNVVLNKIDPLFGDTRLEKLTGQPFILARDKNKYFIGEIE